MRQEAVVARIVHRRVQEAVHEQRAARLVHFVLDRLAAHRNFNDDVDVPRCILAHWDLRDIHELFPRFRSVTPLLARSPGRANGIRRARVGV